MNQVQPPRSRASRHRPETINVLRSTIINAGTVLVTALLVRFAILLAVPTTQERGLKLVERATDLIVWPLERIAPLQRFIHAGFTVADLVTLVVIVVFWLIAMGIVSGWEKEERRLQGTISSSRVRS